VSTGGDALRAGTCMAKESEAVVQRKIQNSSGWWERKKSTAMMRKQGRARQERNFDILSGFLKIHGGYLLIDWISLSFRFGVRISFQIASIFDIYRVFKIIFRSDIWIFWISAQHWILPLFPLSAFCMLGILPLDMHWGLVNELWVSIFVTLWEWFVNNKL